MRIPRGISPASGRGAVSGLSCPQKKMFSAVRTDFFNTGLSSPPMNSVPAGYFTQIKNTTSAEQRPNCLYATPHGPEPKPVRTSSGRLPVSLFLSTATTLCMHILAISCLIVRNIWHILKHCHSHTVEYSTAWKLHVSGFVRGFYLCHHLWCPENLSVPHEWIKQAGNWRAWPQHCMYISVMTLGQTGPLGKRVWQAICFLN